LEFFGEENNSYLQKKDNTYKKTELSREEIHNQPK
jgi:hypothetical protein